MTYIKNMYVFTNIIIWLNYIWSNRYISNKIVKEEKRLKKTKEIRRWEMDGWSNGWGWLRVNKVILYSLLFIISVA